jgi:hypothetical protein
MRTETIELIKHNNENKPNDRVNPEQKHAPKANARLPEPFGTIKIR